MKVYFDMDGVLMDFIGGVHRLHNKPYAYAPNNYGKWDVEQLWGITSEDFWAPVHKNSYQFWANLDLHPEAHALVQMATGIVGEHNICILTTPSSDTGCMSGKTESIRRNFPQFTRRIIFAKEKKWVAGEGRILLDDKDSNIREWTAENGHGILIPRDWNSGFNWAKNVIEKASEGLWAARYK